MKNINMSKRKTGKKDYAGQPVRSGSGGAGNDSKEKQSQLKSGKNTNDNDPTRKTEEQGRTTFGL
jgi:hypothetical protein